MTSALRLSFGLFTILPIDRYSDARKSPPAGAASDPPPMTSATGETATDREQTESGQQAGPAPSAAVVRRAVLLAPVTGLVVAALAAAVLFAVRALIDGDVWGSMATDPLSALVAAALAIMTVELLTGGLHLDGLADTADAIAVRGSAQRSLAVMKDSASGPMGVFAVVMFAVLTTSTLAVAVTRGHGTEALVTAVLAGRVAILWGCTQRSARPDGLGAWVSGSVSRVQALALTVAVMVVPLVLGLLDDDARLGATIAVVAAIPIGVATAWLTTLSIRRRIAGITGDVLGAMAQAATVVSLVVTALAP